MTQWLPDDTLESWALRNGIPAEQVGEIPDWMVSILQANYAPINNPTFTGNVVVPDANADGEALAYDQDNWQLGSGVFTSSPSVSASNPALILNALTTGANLTFRNAGTTRWNLLYESSTNRLFLRRYNTSGLAIDNPILFDDNGTITFGTPVVVPAATAANQAAQVTAINPATGRLAIGGREIGDTGWRKVLSWTAGVQDGANQIGTINTTDWLLNGTGQVLLRRIGDEVLIGFNTGNADSIQALTGGPANLLTANTWPAGFQIDTRQGRSVMVGSSANRPLFTADFGATVLNLRLQSPISEYWSQVTLRYVSTSTVPSLPGVAA